MSDLVERLREFGEMPMEGGKVDPVIETINGLAHEAADEIESLRARITELEAKQRGGSYEETYKALAQADVKRAEEERDTAYARGLKDAAKIADGFDPSHWWDTTDEIEGRLAQGIARAIRAKTEGKG